MFSHITAQRRPKPLITARKNTLFQTRKHYLNIAVGLALTCFTVQVQAADKTQSDNELPVPEAAFEFEDYQVHVQLTEQQWAILYSHMNPPQYLLEIIQKDLAGLYKRGEVTDIIYSALTKHTIALGNIHAGCDRISSTPLPFSYSVLLHRAVYSFCLILPFSLESSLGVWTPVIVALIAYLFLGLDALSAELEEPFGVQENDLALDSIVRNIEREMLSSLGATLPPALSAYKGNLM